MFVMCPMSNCGSPQKRDRFLEYLSKIAPVTYETESQCQAYAWFRSAEDNDTVPHHWLQGFEVYENVEANQVTHRASEPYKVFRAAVGSESLLDRASDLRFWQPTGIGYLNCQSTANILGVTTDSGPQYAVVNELAPRVGMKGQALLHLQLLADGDIATRVSPITFWVLDREDDRDSSLLVFALFANMSEAKAFEGDAESAWKDVEALCESRRRTTWVDGGIGFIGRN